MIPIQNLFSNSLQHSTKIQGSYVLFISLIKNAIIKVGSLGEVQFEKGYYLYIGSAFGPGGLVRRVERHLRKEKKIFWHIDYLLDSPFSEIIAVAWKVGNQKLECLISKELDKLVLIHPLSRFGSSDCNCIGHLKFVNENSVTYFYKVILTRLASFDMVFEEVTNKFSGR